MKKYLFAILLLAASGLYAEINISASVDRSTLNFGDSLTLQVSVSGDAANIPKPSLPPLGEFGVYSSGTSQNISFVNGKVSSSLVYNYILSPNKPGKFTIGPVTVTSGGRTYSTNPINIEVLPAGNPRPQKQAAEEQQPSAGEGGKGIFVTAQLDKKRAFVNEGIIYTFRFYTSRNLASNPQYAPPNFTGFIVEDLPPQRTYQTSINGEAYNVVEVKTQIFPTTPGRYTLGSASLQTSVQDFAGSPFGGFFDDDFFKGFFSSGQPVVLKTKPLTVEVVPLPDEGKPADFSGAVGDYTMRASADTQEVGANNPVTISVEISGVGNVRAVSDPKIPQITGVRRYDTISSFNISKANYRVSGSKTFKTVIIPESPGSVTVPGLEFSYFSPEKKEYRSIKSAPIRIKVIASKTAPDTVAGPQPAAGTVNVVGQDIRFISTVFTKGGARAAGMLSDGIIYISCLILFASILYNRYGAFVSKNSGFIRRKRAFARFGRKMDFAVAAGASAERFYGLAFESVMEYLSGKTGSQLSGLTFREIENVLARSGMPREHIERLRGLLEEADFMRFAPSAGKKIDIAEELKKIKALVSSIEKGWKI